MFLILSYQKNVVRTFLVKVLKIENWNLIIRSFTMLNLLIKCFTNRTDLQYNKRQIKRVANPDLIGSQNMTNLSQEIAHLYINVNRKVCSSDDTNVKQEEKQKIFAFYFQF